jgi:hypothetical protein
MAAKRTVVEREPARPDNRVIMAMTRMIGEYEEALTGDLSPLLKAGKGGPLADWQIKARMALPEGNPLRLKIDPFAPPTKQKGRISFGLSSFGYDIRLGRRFRIFQRPMPVVKEMSPTQAAWVAGMIDGEGSLHYGGKRGYEQKYPRIGVGMTCERTLKMLKHVTGAGNVTAKNGGEPRKAGELPQWAWDVGKTKAVLQILLRGSGGKPLRRSR